MLAPMIGQRKGKQPASLQSRNADMAPFCQYKTCKSQQLEKRLRSEVFPRKTQEASEIDV